MRKENEQRAKRGEKKRPIVKKDPVIFHAVEHFVRSQACIDMVSASKLHREVDSVVFSPWEIEQYNHAKCTAIVRLMNFLCALLTNDAKNTMEMIPATIWCEKLWDIIILCTIRPEKLGFNMADVEIMDQLPKEVLQY